MENETEKWKKAEKYLTEYEETVRSLMNTPGCNMNFLAGIVIGIRKRFDQGERTENLYQEIMNLS